MRVSDSEAKNHIGHPHFIGPPGRSEQLALDLLDSRAEIARLNGVIEGKDARIKGAEDQAHIEWEEAERLTAALESVAAARRLDEAHIIASTALEANPEGEGLLRGKLASQAEEIERLRDRRREEMLSPAAAVLQEVMEQREEIARAFIAKYGFDPEDTVQVESETPTGRTWCIERKSARERSDGAGRTQ